MKVKKNSNKVGGALVMAMMIMLIFTALAIGLFRLFQTDAVETIYVEQHRRAFWMAETGLEKVLDKMQHDTDFRNNPGSYVPYTVSFSEGTHTNDSYKIASITASSAGATGTLYTVEAVGYAGNLNRRIEQEVLARPGGPNALRATGGDIVVDSNVHIDGDVFVDEGDLTIDSKENLSSAKNPTGVDGFVVVVMGSVDGNGAATVDVIEAPPPPPPTIDMTFWQPFLNDVTNNANTNGLAGVSALSLTTVKSNFNYGATMMGTNGITISGTVNDANNLHYMVSADGIIFDNWTVLESQTAIIVQGDVRFDQKLEFHNNCVVFATGDIYVRQSSDAGGLGATLIAQGDIELEQNMVFHGIIFAEGSVDVGQNAEVVGTIIADEGINIGSNVEITFDPDVFLNPLPGLSNVWSQASLFPGRWTELAPE